MKSKKKSQLSFFLLIVITFILMNFQPLVSFFSQDDFYHLRSIMDKSLSDIPVFFTTWQEGQTFYRPISREVFNLFMYKTFGLDPLPFHLVNLLLIIGIGIFSYKLIIKATKNHIVANIFIVLYLISPVHSIELYYLASVQTLLSTIFLLVAASFYINFRNENKIKNLLYCYISFVFALLSHGIGVVFPAIIVAIELFLVKGTSPLINKKSWILILTFAAVDIFYILYSALFSLPKQENYQTALSVKSMINTFSWYTLWSFGLPEMLADFIGPKFSINPNLIKWYGNYFVQVLSLLALIFFTLFFIIRKNWKILSDKFSLFSMALFLLGLVPFVIFPNHKFIYYLSFSVIWFAAFVSYIFSQGFNQKNGTIKLLTTLSILAFVIISFLTTQINSITHWSAKRAAAAKFLLNDIKNEYPMVENKSVFIIVDDPNYPDIAKEWGSSSKQAFYILSGDDALKLLYKDSSIKAVFEGKKNYSSDILMNNKTLPYQAKFPY